MIQSRDRPNGLPQGPRQHESSMAQDPDVYARLTDPRGFTGMYAERYDAAHAEGGDGGEP